MKIDQEFIRAIQLIPADLQMEPVAGGVSKAGDLAYVYGNLTYKDSKENYLRVWQRTSSGWKTILQVLKW
ncbi:MAG: hypothetical protein JWN76_2518 [Chitinophagaceae bacterium]|nr:hypothetical protein [Chitinophagaceae bacterium]